jgi:hypothetical protein
MIGKNVIHPLEEKLIHAVIGSTNASPYFRKRKDIFISDYFAVEAN